MAHGIKVSVEGEDVSTAEDKDLVFSSDWNTFKIVSKDNVNLVTDTLIENPLDGDDWYEGETSVNHNINGIPVTFSYFKDGDRYFLGNTGFLWYVTGLYRFWAYKTETQLKFSGSSFVQNDSYPIYYVICRETYE